VLFWISSAVLVSILLIILVQRPSRRVTVRASHGGQFRTQYPICGMTLDLGDSIDADLSVVDLVYIATATYSEHSEVGSDWDRWFGGDHNASAIHHHSDPTFFHFEVGQKGIVNVVAIRGPRRMTDAVMGTLLWSEAFSLRMMSVVVPLTDLLPDGFLRRFVDVASFTERWIAPDLRAMTDDPIYQYVVGEIVSDSSWNNQSNLLLVGHSLGAGLAQMVGGRLHHDGYADIGRVHSFGLSSPGTLYSAQKLGFAVNDLDESTISVMPRGDFVRVMDDHGGNLQMIQCAEPTAKCHRSVNSLCELYSKCNAELFRNITFMECLCTEQYDWDLCG